MNERIGSLLATKWFVPTVVGVVSFGAGVATGYFLSRDEIVEVVPAEPLRLVPVLEDDSLFEEKMREAAELEEAQAEQREQDAIRMALLSEGTVVTDDIIDDGFPTYPDDEPNPLDITVDYEALEEMQRAEAPDDGMRSIWANNEDPDWDYEEEKLKRTKTAPYVLHKDEFWAEERGWSQTTLTYYAGDDVLTDSDDQPIYDVAGLVGELKFGHGSGDQNVFHVRNEKLEAEYEVIRDSGKFAQVVLGAEVEEAAEKAELRHSRQRKFKTDD